jgi:hypothetical protein
LNFELENSMAEESTDPFDRLYASWARQVIGKRAAPPSRERWDSIVLRLILSEDPDRVNRYRRIEGTEPESLGADAYELWSKMPSYTPNLTVSAAQWPDFAEYERAHRGSMKRLMGDQGLLERYDAIVAAQSEPARTPADRAQARRAQAGVLIIGCVGMSLIAFMVLTVLLIMALRFSG